MTTTTENTTTSTTENTTTSANTESVSQEQWDLLKARWDDGVEPGMADALAGYVVNHLQPGRCLTGILANDYEMFLGSAHPALTITALKQLDNFIMKVCPQRALGSLDAVTRWLK